MLENGYIRLYRSLLNWEWYDDPNTFRVFLHLLLTVNYEPKQWRGIVVQRGQRVYSSQKLADELHVSRQVTRTSIKHLISTGEITNLSTPEYSIITVKNYDSYQQLTNELTNDQPTTNQRLTNDQPQCNKANKANKVKEYNIYPEIINFLNEKAGTQYKYTSTKTRSLIDARLNEKFTLEDFKTVISKKCAEWNHEPEKGKEDMRKYLRPETLFGNKFEGYLNQAPVKPHEPKQNPSAWKGKGEQSTIDLDRIQEAMYAQYREGGSGQEGTVD